VRGNHFAHNIIGLFFYGEGSATVSSTTASSHNLTTVAISAPGAGSATVWRGNYWDEYQGFDRDGDGYRRHAARGAAVRRPHLDGNAAGDLLPQQPGAGMLDFLERLAPFSSPVRVLQDRSPRLPQLNQRSETR
jgi:nitrous oxidase accessory protein